jgi:DNA-binding FrmR family transcriptional regulator
VHHTDKIPLINRLNRIEGQVRGIRGMVEDGRYCIDVLTQVRAARAALARFETEMLKGHLAHCVEAAIASGDPDDQRAKIAEIVTLLNRADR